MPGGGPPPYDAVTGQRQYPHLYYARRRSGAFRRERPGISDFCLVDGDEARYTKTVTTPLDLSRCLFDGLTKVSELVYGEPQLAALPQSTDHIRYSTTQGTTR